MAVDEEQIEETEVEAAPPPRRRRMGLLAVLVLLGGSGGGAWFYLGLPQAGESEPAPIYYTLDSNLIVNFEGGGRVRYLQLGIELMTRERRAIEALETHAPVMRNNLIMLLSDYGYDELITRQGKEALREAALAEVQDVMRDRYGSAVVETLYFTTFVMQ